MATTTYTSTTSSGGKIVTTVTNTKFDNGVLDISILPYIKNMPIYFVAQMMRPEVPLFFYFEDYYVYNFIALPNIIKLSGTKQYADIITTEIPDKIVSGSNSADVILCTKDVDTQNTVLYVANVSGVFSSGRVISARGNNSTIVEYIHKSGTAQGGNTTVVTLSNDAKSMANNYWGVDGSNVIWLCAGTGVNQYANIGGFNNVTCNLTLTETLTTAPGSNTQYSIGYHYSDEFGQLPGIFYLPNLPTVKFRTGENLFRIMDNDSNDVTGCTTRADYTFSATGFRQTRNQVVIKDIKSTVIPPPDPTVDPPPIKPPPVIVPPPFHPPFPREHTNAGGEGGSHGADPLAQTFFVPQNQFPNGLFITAVDLFFKKKDANNLPVQVQIRPTVNGYPHSSVIIEDAIVTLTPNQVNISNTPNTQVASTVTTFKFRAPIYLPSGEWALVILSKSMDYQVYIAELGKAMIGSGRIVSEQPYVGSLFKSQNSSTWTPFQLQDLMFKLRRASFGSSGTVTFKNKAPVPSAPTDLLYTHVSDMVIPNTSVKYTHSVDSGSTFTQYDEDTHYTPSDRINFSALGQYQLLATMTTNDSAVSPVVYHKEFTTIAIQNLINNANITNNQIVIVNEGSGYAANANIALSFGTGAGNTSAAKGFAVADPNGSIDQVFITETGAGFIRDMTVTPASGNSQFSFSSELDPFGGPCLAKYISRIVTLADGFEAGDLRVYLTAKKITGTDIKVYYKIKHKNDPDSFDEKNYVLMEQKTGTSTFSKDASDIIEYEYRPSLNAASISYTTANDVTYKTFNQFAFKIVLISDNTTKYPTIFDMRGIALPASEF
jgi:hypothetical protein